LPKASLLGVSIPSERDYGFLQIILNSRQIGNINVFSFQHLYVKTSDIEIVRSGAAYTVLNQDNLTKIAEKIYGSATNHEVEAIYQANKRIIGNDKNLIHPGQKLFVPYPVT
jgi:nucleoid-associated protein YgaU